MSLSEYSSVVFSKTLAGATRWRRNDALSELEGYLKEHPSLLNGGLVTPFYAYQEGLKKAYYGTELFQARLREPERQRIKDIGFDIRDYPRTGHQRKYVAVALSDELAVQKPEEKIGAILQLRDYFERHLDIWTGYQRTMPIAEAAARFLEGRVNLKRQIQSEIIRGDMTRRQRKHVRAFGFDVKYADNGLAFVR